MKPIPAVGLPPAKAARCCPCGQCWKEPGQPCTPAGDHLARFARAFRRGLITDAGMVAVFEAADVIANWQVVQVPAA